MLNFVIAILCEALEEISKRKKEKGKKTTERSNENKVIIYEKGECVNITINGKVRQIVGSAEDVNREDVNDCFFELFNEVQHFKKLDELNEQYVVALVRTRERLASDVRSIEKMFGQGGAW